MKIIVIAAAYELEAGGFRGAALDKATKVRKQGEVQPTLQAARNDARILAHELCAGRMYRAAAMPKKTEWSCNYWAE